MKDTFLGTWQLDPEQNNYQSGNPPKTGLYIIQPKDEGYLVTMKWTNQDNQDFEMSYEAIPDGKDYPTDAPNVDSMSMTRVDEKTLDSSSMSGYTVIAFARRILSEDNNTMTITQSGKTPDGDDFANVSAYKRVLDA